MLGVKGKDVSCSTSCTGKATHTQMTYGLHIKTSIPLNSLQNSCIPTLPWLDDRRYKSHHFPYQIPIFPLSLIEQSEELSTAFICPSLKHNMSCLSTPIFVSSRDSTPSPPSRSPDERTNNGAFDLAIRVHYAQGCMTATTTSLTATQIQ